MLAGYRLNFRIVFSVAVSGTFTSATYSYAKAFCPDRFGVVWYKLRETLVEGDLESKGLSRNKVYRPDSYRVDEVILFFFKAQIEANSRRLLATPIAIGVATQKKDKRTSQNVKVILGQVLSQHFLKQYHTSV